MNINIPISYGELVDKLTILEIKQQKIENQDKLKNINNEYLELDEVAKYLKNIDKIEYENFYKKLFEVNLGLWEIEDKIRILEKDKNFDNEFIELARKVYFTNDKRFEIKSEINKHFGSEFFEEKQYVEYE
jgi:glutamyl/glutaminyl-tRNA synthetase